MLLSGMQLPTLEGQLIRIRPLKRSDAPAIAKGIGLRAVSRWLPQVPFPYTLNDAHAWINHAHATARKETECNFGIERLDEPGIVGGIGLSRVNRTLGNAETGYWIAKPHWGKGYGREALSLILGFAFGELKLHRVYAYVIEGNDRSAALLEGHGFIREGALREACRHGRGWGDFRVYGLLCHEWEMKMQGPR